MEKHLFKWLVAQKKASAIELHLYFEGVDYDCNFEYNEYTNVLTADSSSMPNISFGGDGRTISEHIMQRNIEIKVKFI